MPIDASPRWWTSLSGGVLIIAGLAVGVLIIISANGSAHGWIAAGAGAVLAGTIPIGVGVKMLRLPRRRGYLIGLTLGWLPGVAIAFDALDSILEPSRWLSSGLRGNHSVNQARISGVAGLLVAAVFIAVWAGTTYTYRHPTPPAASR